ncbi:B12-binding domain-containing radical SAM protein [Methanomicrobiaceae archaeon CYW5]|uniref:TIGR04013 family B12-binding domain/radical SAM domain-containing protein n=1 Tax=Methanovulcanius yangii TaxID=1789227 RepID=UPI0029CAAA77|nr:TIGR04013 family B12-binding domain/radical SAM domain-containing protein [Methanovulcanius yangii]MBT8507288.1 B12-binding domain-containing radical SAM protein [Methanovulcanius yangii]
MRVNWRSIKWAKNSYAALYAACEQSGILLHETNKPADDITCYSLNSIDEPHYRDEIADAGCITIVGGPHASACPHEVATYADYVVVGEGEFTLPALIRSIGDGCGHVPPGVCSGDVCRPSTSQVFLPAYRPFTRVKGTIEISRGCPYHCAYCQTPCLFGNRMRHRTIEGIVEAAEHYRDVRFVTPNALAYGSDGTHPRLDRVEALLRALKGHRIFFGTFPSEVRPEWITDESLDLITSYASNRKLHFGAQSGSDRVLRLLKRGHTTGDVMHAVDLCHDHGIIPVVDYIFGFPFETDEDQNASIEQIREVARYGKIHAHYFTPLPGTPLAGTTPRDVLPEVQNILGNLALRGKATGSWIEAEIRFFSRNENQYP